MKILKFGGTSVGKPERMKSIAEITNDGEAKIVVLSAVSGTTNALVEIGEQLSKGDKAAAQAVVDKLWPVYTDFVANLYTSDAGKAAGTAIITEHFDLIKSLFAQNVGDDEKKVLLAQGELISTKMFSQFLTEIGRKNVLLPALDFMSIDEDDEPVLSKIESALSEILKNNSDCKYFVTQGYIALNPQGKIDNLKRGGSDYTATLIGAALRSEEVQIWTDIDGMHNNDPRIVRKTFPIRELCFEEAAELAYFGAKILHPTCIRPTMERGVPVRLLNTMQPKEKGTLISANNNSGRRITAIAAKDGITAIKIKSGRMLNAYGFLSKVFSVFEKYKTAIDVITTSEVALSMTIDEDKNVDKIIAELEQIGTVEVDKNQTIICIVGDFSADSTGVVLDIFTAMREVPMRMISYGGSKFNTTLLVKNEHKNEALNALNEGLFKEELAMA
ncbi:MAG: aspartate kinase [Cytophagales bacterium]